VVDLLAAVVFNVYCKPAITPPPVVVVPDEPPEAVVPVVSKLTLPIPWQQRH